MKVGIFSHCTMDTIVYENKQYEAPGGPASYCSLTARKQKHDVNLYTKFGPNYPLEEFFKELGKTVRTIPQIVIDGKHIGSFNELTEYFADKGKINYKGDLIE